MVTPGHQARGVPGTQGNFPGSNVERLSDHGNIDPSIANNAAPENETGSVLHLYRKALKTWSNLRFVRAGWFTAVEAMSYIE